MIFVNIFLVSIGCFFFRIKTAEKYTSAIHLSLSYPLSLPPTNTNVFRCFFALHSAILHIFAARTYSQIRPSIVKWVPVNMIYFKSFEWMPYNGMMQENTNIFTTAANFSYCITFFIRCIFLKPPTVFRQMRVAFIDYCEFILSQSYLHNYRLYQVGGY